MRKTIKSLEDEIQRLNTSYRVLEGSFNQIKALFPSEGYRDEKSLFSKVLELKTYREFHEGRAACDHIQEINRLMLLLRLGMNDPSFEIHALTDEEQHNRGMMNGNPFLPKSY